MAPPRRTMAGKRFQETQKTWIVPFLTASAIIIVLGLLTFGVFAFKPRTLECITTENTFCRQDILDSLESLRSVRFFLPGKSLREKESQLASLFPDLATVAIKRTPQGTVHAIITLAKPLLSCTLNGQSVLIRENGYVSPAQPTEGQLEVALTATVSGGQLTYPWGKQEQKNLAQLVEELGHFRPRIKKIVTNEPTKVIAYPDGNGPIFLRVNDGANISVQLSTLQAFFRSTTMETPYQELDVRFTHLIIKE